MLQGGQLYLLRSVPGTQKLTPVFEMCSSLVVNSIVLLGMTIHKLLAECTYATCLTFLYLSSQVSWGKQGPALVSCRVRPHLRLNGDSTGNHGPMLPLSEAGFCDCPPGQSLTGQ